MFANWLGNLTILSNRCIWVKTSVKYSFTASKWILTQTSLGPADNMLKETLHLEVPAPPLKFPPLTQTRKVEWIKTDWIEWIWKMDRTNYKLNWMNIQIEFNWMNTETKLKQYWQKLNWMDFKIELNE